MIFLLLYFIIIIFIALNKSESIFFCYLCYSIRMYSLMNIHMLNVLWHASELRYNYDCLKVRRVYCNVTKGMWF